MNLEIALGMGPAKSGWCLTFWIWQLLHHLANRFSEADTEGAIKMKKHSAAWPGSVSGRGEETEPQEKPHCKEWNRGPGAAHKAGPGTSYVTTGQL
jgi:hypothetical protein